MEVKNALELAEENYKEYGLYVGTGRSFPHVIDGMKTVYKRIIYSMAKNSGRSMQKVVTLAGPALELHPHPESVPGAIVSLGDRGNKLKLMDTKGQWGDSSKGIGAAAVRYIDGRLSELAIKLFCESYEYCPMIEGELPDKQEPMALPAMLPLCFINGTQGISSGLSSVNIPTLDIIGMIDYYIDILRHKDLDYHPKNYPNPNFGVNVVSPKEDWENLLKNGKGTVRTAPTLEWEDASKRKIKITALPESKTFEHVRKILEKDIMLDKVDVLDETVSDTLITIEKVPKKWVDMEEIYQRLEKKLESSNSYAMIFFDENNKILNPCSFNYVVQQGIKYQIRVNKSRIKNQILQLNNKLLILQIIEKMKKDKLIIKMVEMTHDESIDFLSDTYKIDREISKQVLQRPISYLTKEHYQEIVDLENEINSLKDEEKDLFEYLLKKYKELRKEMCKILKSQKETKFIKVAE